MWILRTSKKLSPASVSDATVSEPVRETDWLLEAVVHGPMSQADFLGWMGLSLRVAALTATTLSDQRKEAIREGALRLVDRNGMGTQYQVLGIASGGVQQEELWPFGQRLS